MRAWSPGQPIQAQRPLSQREKQILALAAQGLTREQIGERIYVTGNTVKTHLRRINIALGEPGGGTPGCVAAALVRGELDFDPSERKIVPG